MDSSACRVHTETRWALLASATRSAGTWEADVLCNADVLWPTGYVFFQPVPSSGVVPLPCHAAGAWSLDVAGCIGGRGSRTMSPTWASGMGQRSSALLGSLPSALRGSWQALPGTEHVRYQAIMHTVLPVCLWRTTPAEPRLGGSSEPSATVGSDCSCRANALSWKACFERGKRSLGA